MKTPTTKAENNILWKSGELGNRIRMWTHMFQVADANVKDVTVRSLTPGSKNCFYRVPHTDVWKYMDGNYYFNESCPDEDLTMQGEVTRTWDGWHLTYSTQQAPMRIALRESGKHASGVTVLSLLKYYCNPNGYDMLMELFDQFDTEGKECVIEFSCYNRHLGIFPNNNTIIWEVRAY